MVPALSRSSLFVAALLLLSGCGLLKDPDTTVPHFRQCMSGKTKHLATMRLVYYRRVVEGETLTVEAFELDLARSKRRGYRFSSPVGNAPPALTSGEAGMLKALEKRTWRPLEDSLRQAAIDWLKTDPPEMYIEAGDPTREDSERIYVLHGSTSWSTKVLRRTVLDKELAPVAEWNAFLRTAGVRP